MAPKGPANNDPTDKEYDAQFVWDVDKEEPMEDAEDPDDEDLSDTLMERIEAGGKGKAEINNVLQTKQAKNEVHVSTKKEEHSVQERMRARGKAALEKEDGYATDIRMEWQLKHTDKNFNLRTATMELLRKM
eukprot:12813123-Ditylum_brightwellii.AAC.1